MAVKKAYYKLARTHHPDKGGDEQKFQALSAAYEILSDPERRADYDKYGLPSEDDGGVREEPEEGWTTYFKNMFRRVDEGEIRYITTRPQDSRRNEWTTLTHALHTLHAP